MEVRTFGHALEVDARGKGGPPPMALILTSLGGCHFALLKHVLRLMKIEWGEIQLRVEAEETETEPKVYTQVHLTHEITGQGLSEQRLLLAVAMAEKYCSVSIMLHNAGGRGNLRRPGPGSRTPDAVTARPTLYAQIRILTLPSSTRTG
ncbi:MAG: OsmC family protein [Candidatus Thermoplasmatota archaeon]|nr:OsmC family protein [Candidatus Thermoplasmatota archaeon]